MLQDFINRAAYMAHGYCLLWKPWLIAIHASSDILIFGSYFAIPVAIWIFLGKRTDLTLKPLAVLFAAFIFLCGLTHAISGRDPVVARLRSPRVCEGSNGARFGHNRNRDFPAYSESRCHSKSESIANRE